MTVWEGWRGRGEGGTEGCAGGPAVLQRLMGILLN